MTIQLHEGDALEILAGLPEASVDAVVTDPPYQQTGFAWDKWVHDWPDAVARVLKPGGSMWVFGTLRMFVDRRQDFRNWKMAQDIIWEKNNGSSAHNDRFRRVHEQAVQYYQGPWAEVYKGEVFQPGTENRVAVVRRRHGSGFMGRAGGEGHEQKTGGPLLMRSVIYAASENGKALHPTQKPEPILEPLILNACPPGGVVLDPFGGSGSTGFVAARLGRRAVLIERDPGYCDVIRRRFEADLFAPRI